MSVIRVNKTRDFTVMSNTHLKDKNMSLKAKGLLSVMLGLPDDWSYSIAGLVAISKENETAIKSALTELKELGYLVMTRKLPNETTSGRIEYIYDIYEQPREKQGVENLSVECLPVENPGQVNTKEVNTNKENNKKYKIKNLPLVKIESSYSSNQLAAKILEHLNVVAGSRFKATETNLKPIKARLAEKFTEQDCMMVIEYKVKEWKGTDFQKYLRPETLFRPSKFEGYLNAAITKAPTHSVNRGADTLAGVTTKTAFKDLSADEQKDRLSGIKF